MSFTSHSGDCTIYSSLINGCPWDGICTCGYGWEQVRAGDESHMLSEERLEQIKIPKAKLRPLEKQACCDECGHNAYTRVAVEDVVLCLKCFRKVRP